MIRASELRIGNRLLYGGKLLIVEPQDFENLDWSKAEAHMLTEEWLKRFGFKETINSEFVKYWNKENIQLYHEYYRKTPLIVYNQYTQLQHVHQLQNLYFALTGEELIYTP